MLEYLRFKAGKLHNWWLLSSLIINTTAYLKIYSLLLIFSIIRASSYSSTNSSKSEAISPQNTCDLPINAHSALLTFRTQFCISFLLFTFYKSQRTALSVNKYWFEVVQDVMEKNSLQCVEPAMWNCINSVHKNNTLIMDNDVDWGLLVIKVKGLVPNFLFHSFSPITADCLHSGHKTWTCLSLHYPYIQGRKYDEHYKMVKSVIDFAAWLF